MRERQNESNCGTIDAMLSRRPYEKEDQDALVIAAQNGDKDAADKLALSYSRYVYKMAKRYSSPDLTYLSVDDLFMVGVEILYHAIETYDNSVASFSTYATFWIKQAILREINNTSPTVRIPVHTAANLQTLKRRVNSFVVTFGCQPTKDDLRELCKDLKADVSMLQQAEKMISAGSIYSVVGEDGDSELIDFVGATRSAEEEYMDASRPTARDILESFSLSEQERDVLSFRFGFAGDKLTLEEVGNLYGVSRERARQIQDKALRKINLSLDLSKNAQLKRDLHEELEEYEREA